ncbi:unnamed protein product, partial [Thelazia callipaeda]|uniref:Dual specificity protein phosphatase 14 n=1 Tax=Thelazia callipaeda TaxID=103827 RepID=A0A0N5D4U2_THECL
VPNIQALGKIPRIKLWLQDNTLTSVYPILDLETDQIESVISAGGNVLVHSVAGISRSATICLAYLTKFRCKSLREAYHVMSKTRPLVRPNIGFWRQLIAYEQDIKQSKGTVRLIKDKTNFDELIPDVYFSQEIETSKSLEVKF